MMMLMTMMMTLKVMVVGLAGRHKLLWALSFVLAPHTRLLDYHTQHTHMQLFVGRIMPPLLEQGFARIHPHARPPGAPRTPPCVSV
jgi:hypothetical protein